MPVRINRSDSTRLDSIRPEAFTIQGAAANQSVNKMVSTFTLSTVQPWISVTKYFRALEHFSKSDQLFNLLFIFYPLSLPTKH